MLPDWQKLPIAEWGLPIAGRGLPIAEKILPVRGCVTVPLTSCCLAGKVLDEEQPVVAQDGDCTVLHTIVVSHGYLVSVSKGLTHHCCCRRHQLECTKSQRRGRTLGKGPSEVSYIGRSSVLLFPDAALAG